MTSLHLIHLIETVQPGDHVLLGLSGGPDSMALFDLLLKDAAHRGYSLEAIHFDHGLRGTSAEEAAWVADYAAGRGVVCRVEELPVHDYAAQHGTGLEGAGHVLRREALEQQRRKCGADWIALGHHADDQAETLLLHLIRGSGLTGLTGMAVRRGRVLRPLLHLRKADLLAYCEALHIPFVTDPSNFDTRFARNALRHDILPLLEKQNPKIVETLCQTADTLQHDDAVLQALSQDHFTKLSWKAPGRVLLDREGLKSLPTALCRRVLQKAVDHFSTLRLHSALYQQLENALRDRQATSEVRISGDLSFWFGREKVVLEKRHVEPLPEDQVWEGREPLEVPPYYALIPEVSLPRTDPDRMGLWLPGPQDFLVRTRCPGDAVAIAGLGRKSVKKIYQEAALSPYRRSWWPVICSADDGEILWIPGLAVAKTCQLVDNCEDMGIYIKMRLL